MSEVKCAVNVYINKNLTEKQEEVLAESIADAVANVADIGCCKIVYIRMKRRKDKNKKSPPEEEGLFLLDLFSFFQL